VSVPCGTICTQEKDKSAFMNEAAPSAAADALGKLFPTYKFPLHAGFLTPETDRTAWCDPAYTLWRPERY
jgi:hypothetical protein